MDRMSNNFEGGWMFVERRFTQMTRRTLMDAERAAFVDDIGGFGVRMGCLSGG